MTHPVPARILTGCLLLATGIGISACGSSKSDKVATPAKPSLTVSATAGLSRAEVNAKINTACSAIDAKYRQIPAPAGANDVGAIATYLQSSLALFDSYIAQVEPLVAQSPDRAALEAKWLTIEKQDTAQVKPLANKLLAAAKTHDAASIAAAEKGLDALPDHTADFISVMNAHGLTGCAKLETDTEG
ncbi:MAG: hypothetical protein ABI140_07480 [Jatrophihabitantaceae bacterium]